jgi:hypothetical protein
LLAIVTAVTVLAGCIGGGDGGTGSAGVGGTTAGPEEASEQEPNQTVTLQREYDGFLVYRSIGDSEPLIREQGNSTTFCFNVPEDTRSFQGHLEWIPPEQMGLEFKGPEKTKKSYNIGNPASLYSLPPIDLRVQDPAPGTWFAYAGPGASGVAIDWNLTMTWNVERGNASVNETFYYGEPCN